MSSGQRRRPTGRPSTEIRASASVWNATFAGFASSVDLEHVRRALRRRPPACRRGSSRAPRRGRRASPGSMLTSVNGSTGLPSNAAVTAGISSCSVSLISCMPDGVAAVPASVTETPSCVCSAASSAETLTPALDRACRARAASRPGRIGGIGDAAAGLHLVEIELVELDRARDVLGPRSTRYWRRYACAAENAISGSGAALYASSKFCAAAAKFCAWYAFSPARKYASAFVRSSACAMPRREHEARARELLHCGTALRLAGRHRATCTAGRCELGHERARRDVEREQIVDRVAGDVTEEDPLDRVRRPRARARSCTGCRPTRRGTPA